MGSTGDVLAHALNCRETLPNFVVGVQSISLQQYALHHVRNVHDKFQSCTVALQAATMLWNNPRAELEYVYIQNVWHYAPHYITNTYKTSFGVVQPM